MIKQHLPITYQAPHRTTAQRSLGMADRCTLPWIQGSSRDFAVEVEFHG